MDLSDSATPGWLGIIFQISQLLYLVVALFVGGRLLRLAIRTGEAPERWLGLQFLIGSGIAYPILIAGILSSSPGAAAPSAGAPTASVWMMALGYLGIDIAVLFMMLFVRTVFRSTEVWAARLVWCGVVCTAVAYAGMALSGQFARPTLNGSFYWFHYLSTAWVSVWVACEAFRYHAQMRRRLRLGLADAIVTNRFLLWGSASLCGLVIVLLGATPQLYMGLEPEAARAVSNLVLTGMSLSGVVAVGLYWLTFFPTKAYLRFVERHHATESSAS